MSSTPQALPAAGRSASRFSTFAPIVAAMLMVAVLALGLPAYSGPDESGHVAYVSALAQGHLPIIPEGQVADIATGTSWQGQHPPLFYLLATPSFLLVGKSPTLELYALRLLGAVMLAATVALVQRLAALLLEEQEGEGGLPLGVASGLAAWFVALHPTLGYVCAMVNNEALAMVLSVACVWAAARCRAASSREAAGPGEERKWLALAALLGGLALLTKLTAVAGVVAAAFLAGQGRARKVALGRGVSILSGAVLLWLPWGLLMLSTQGTLVPSPVHRAIFHEGLWSLTLYPVSALNVTIVCCGMFASGLLFPNWLVMPFDITYYPILMTGWVVAAWVLWTCWKRRGLRFVGAGFVVMGLLLLAQVMFRDFDTSLFLARYSPTSISLASLLVAGAVGPAWRLRKAFFGAWAIFALAFQLYFFYFFYFFHASRPGMGTWHWKW